MKLDTGQRLKPAVKANTWPWGQDHQNRFVLPLRKPYSLEARPAVPADNKKQPSAHTKQQKIQKVKMRKKAKR